MKDYQPLDLTNICNTEADKINLGISYEQGKSTMRGIPFIIGNNANNNMIVVSSQKIGTIKIPIETQANRIIVAHRLLEVSQDAPTGIKVADYIFNYDDGSKIKEENKFYWPGKKNSEARTKKKMSFICKQKEF